MPYPYTVSRTTWLAGATETTPGTAITAPKWFIPLKIGGGMNKTKKALIGESTRGTRAKVNTELDGVYAYVGKVESEFLPQDHTALVRMGMGKDTTTQPASGTDPAVYDHACSLENVNVLTATLFDNLWSTANKTYRYTWATVNKMNFKWNVENSLLMFSADLLALARTQPTLAVPTAVWETSLPFQGWLPSITKGGVSSYALMTDCEIDIENNMSPAYGSTGNQEANAMKYGEQTVKVKMTLFANQTDYSLWDSTPGTDELLTVVFVSQEAAMTGTSAYHKQITFSIPKLHYETSTIDRSSNLVMMKVDGQAIYDSTSSSLATITIRNDKAATYY